MQTTVVKFGGSSLASAQQFKKVADIIRSDPSRRFVVASAPGKRCSEDVKVTDMLYKCYELAGNGGDYENQLDMIKERFTSIADELEIDFDIDAEIAVIRAHLADKPDAEYMASRGEHLNSKLLALYLGYKFIDAAEVIRFNTDGSFDDTETYRILAAAVKGVKNAVIPGFYGAQADGRIRTFSRGGSDVTGAIVAHAVDADMYENWTDVSGMLMADPRVVENPKPIEFISYRELRELSYMGATVLHEEAVFPARTLGIPINIRNTNRPEDPGTMITKAVPPTFANNPVTGIAGSKGFSSILIEKAMMNSEIGFACTVLELFKKHGLAFEHMPSGIDTISFVLKTEELEACREELFEEINAALEPDTLTVDSGFAMIAIVGHGMVYRAGVAARVFAAVGNAGINIRMIDQGSSGYNIIIGVAEDDYAATIKAIYDEFNNQ